MRRQLIVQSGTLAVVRTMAALFIVAVAVVQPTRLWAQDDPVGPRILRLAGSTRALGLGDVHPVGSTDSDAIFYHAGFADRLRGASLGVQLYGGSGSTLFTASAATDWWGGAIAVGVRALDYGTDTSLESVVSNVSELPLFERGPNVGSERAASLAYARRVKGLRGGVTAHLVELRRSESRETVLAGDFAVGSDFGVISAGLAARNLGGGYHLGLQNDFDLPSLITLSAAGSRPLPVGPLDLLPVAALTYEFHGDLIPAAGIELSYWPVSGRTFTLRLGARRAEDGMRPFTAGFGFTGDKLILDYAIVPFENDRFVHRFGMRWR